MARDVIAIGLGLKARTAVNNLQNDITSGNLIVTKAYSDQAGVNIKTYYAKKTDIEHITVDIIPYTDAEIDSLLGIG